MRVSVMRNDPGYRGEGPYALEVLLDGKVVQDVHTADEEKGEVWCNARDRDGKFLIDVVNDRLFDVCYHGAVRIRPKVAVRG